MLRRSIYHSNNSLRQKKLCVPISTENMMTRSLVDREMKIMHEQGPIYLSGGSIVCLCVIGR